MSETNVEAEGVEDPAAEQSQSDHEAWQVANSDKLDADADFRQTREAEADKEAEDRETLYGRRAEPAPEPVEQDDAAEDETEVRRARQVESLMPDATAAFRDEAAAFQQRLAQFSQIQDPNARAQLEPVLRRDAAALEQKRMVLARGALEKEKQRLFGLRPALRNPKMREKLIQWAEKKHGLTKEQAASVTDTGTVIRAYDEMMGDFSIARKGQEAEEEKQRAAQAKKADRKRFDALPVAARVNETRGEFDSAIVLYGDPATSRAHVAAVRRNMEPRR